MLTNPAKQCVHGYFNYIFSIEIVPGQFLKVLSTDKLYVKYDKNVRPNFKQNRMYTSNGVFFLQSNHFWRLTYQCNDVAILQNVLEIFF